MSFADHSLNTARCFFARATQLIFATQPSGAGYLQVMTGQPIVEARDAAGNLDTDFSATAKLAVCSSGMVTGNTMSFVGGAATSGGTGRSLVASSNGLTRTSESFDITKAGATVSLTYLAPTYDGTAKNGRATTVFIYTPVENISGVTSIAVPRTGSTEFVVSQTVPLIWEPVDDPTQISGLVPLFNAAEDMPLVVGGTAHAVDIDSDPTALVWEAEGYDAKLVAQQWREYSSSIFSVLPLSVRAKIKSQVHTWLGSYA